MRRLWLRWSWRDLRARWPQVAAIALIVGIGSGTYSGLSSTSEWRKVSYDDSFEQVNMWDLRVALSSGSLVDAAALSEAAAAIPHAASVEHAEARLIGATQVDASTKDETILVPGRLVGVDVSDGGPHVASIDAVTGRPLRASDAGRDVGMLDVHFARNYDLVPTGKVRISGDRTIAYVGQGLSPEYFMVIGEEGSLLAEANFAVLFVPIETAQAELGHPGQANDLVLTLREGADRAVVRRELTAALHERFPGVGVTFMNRRDDKGYRYLYDDIEGDQRFYNIFAVLILAGAAFAAFNLTGRIVQAQRREIGIGMALGTRRRELAIRPLLVGLQVALLGVVFGVGVGLVIATLMGGVLKEFFPLPAWEFPFETAVFLRGAILGLLLPFVATLIPVWRAVRVTPVQAIRTGYLSERGSGVAPWLARIPVPGKSTTQLPFRNVLRAPRRTFMTMLGIAVAIMVLIGVLGMVDSFVATIDEADAELTKGSPDRTEVGLDFFYPVDAGEVRAIADSELVARAESHLRLGGELRHGKVKIPALLSLTPFDSPLWQPTIDDRVNVDGPGIVIAEKAAHDLGVEPGDTITLHHPRRTGLTTYELVDTEVPVIGVTPLPTRFVTYMPYEEGARLMNLEGITNLVIVEPARGVSVDEVKRALFGDPGVASVQPVHAFGDAIKKQLERFLDLLTIVEGAVLLLALLIAFNSTSINVDERAREHATMFAFGLPRRTVLRMTVVESVTIGALGTLTGLGLGWLLLDWLIQVLLPQTLPDLGIVTAIAPGTLVTAVVLGIVAVAVAPLFTMRKLRVMDVPSTLRVME